MLHLPTHELLLVLSPLGSTIILVVPAVLLFLLCIGMITPY
jgi:hypothetical protein